MYKQVNNKETNPKETGFYEKILWGISIFLTVLTGAINSVLVIFLLKRIVEVIRQIMESEKCSDNTYFRSWSEAGTVV